MSSGSQRAALAFDMYGTLVDPSGLAGVLADYVSEPESIASGWRRHQLEISWLLSLLERYEDWSAVSTYALDAALAEVGAELAEKQRQELLDRSRVPRLFDDAAPALDALVGAGFMLAVFSNSTPALLEEIVRETGIDRYFAELISVDEIGVFKPAPAVYRHAARRLGRPIGDVWLVSANPFDAAGAKLAGMRVARLTRGHSIHYGFAPAADLTLADLSQLAGELAALAA